MKCVGLQYLEAIRRLQASGFRPLRSVYLSFVPDEEIGGHDGAEKFAKSDVFRGLNVGVVLDEGGFFFFRSYFGRLKSLQVVVECLLLIFLINFGFFFFVFGFWETGLASPSENYRAFYAERGPWWLVIKATGAPGHGAKLYDNTAMENLLKSIESVRRFRASQFDLLKAGLKAEGEVISVNMVFLKAGTPSPTVS